MAAVDPDTLARIAKTVADIYSDATARILRQVARRFARGIEYPGWAEAKLLEIASLRDDAARIVAQLGQDGPPAVRRAIEEAFTAGIDAGAREVRLAPTLRPAANTAAVEALAQETVLRVTSTHGGILRAVDDIFRQVIAEVAAPGVVTGVDTRRAAAQRALWRFADRGVSGFVDRAGRNWSLESYVEMAVRTSSGRAMIDGRAGAYVEAGRPFVIVSDSPSECKLCRPWEGRGLSLTGEGVGSTVGGIPIVGTLDEARNAGFQHPNCRHDVRPIIPGLTEPFTHTADPQGDEDRQRQRALERQVRGWKMREAAALDDDARAYARRKVRERQAALREHVEARGLKRQRHREQVGRAR